MILCLNRERVMTDMLEWARLRLVGLLRCNPCDVQAKWVLDPFNKVVPEFATTNESLEGLSRKMAQDLFKSVSREMKLELNARLRGLTQYRFPRDDEGRLIRNG